MMLSMKEVALVILAISKLVEGRDINDVISTLKGIKCGFKETSCADQLAKALEQAKNK